MGKMTKEEYRKITGFNTPAELAAYEKGQEDQYKTIEKFVIEWNGETNSAFGDLLSQKLINRLK